MTSEMARNISTACPLNCGLIGCIFVRQRYKCWRCWRLYFSGRAGDRELLLPLNMLENHDMMFLLCLLFNDGGWCWTCLCGEVWILVDCWIGKKV